MTQRLIGVGVGPGDPELVTVKAVRVLREADVVLVPVLAGPDPEPGRAETIIREYVAADRIRRLEFALNDTGGVTPRRAAAWQTAAAVVAEEFTRGAGTVAFGTLGDPNLYSTFSYLAQSVRDLVPGVTVETLAGITAMQDLASRAGISLAEGTEPVVLVPLNGGVAALDQALASGGAVVGYKVGAATSPDPAILRDRLHQAGRLDGAVIGARLGLAGELISPAADFLPGTQPGPDIPYLSTLIVPARRQPGTGSGLASAAIHALPVTEVAANAAVPEQDRSPQYPNDSDGASLSSQPQRCSIAVAASGHAALGEEADRPDGALDRSQPARWDIGPARAGARPVSAGARPVSAGARPVSAATQPGKQQTVGRVCFVGAGPGAPDLLTLRGAHAIAAADVVIWASSLVHPDVLRHAQPNAEIVDSAQLPMEGVLPYYQRAARENLNVARVHSGDPSLWGAIQEQLEQCEKLELDTEIVPGVSSFTAVAARIGRELTIPEVAQSVILTRLGGGKTPMPAGEQVAEFARHGTTMALFLSAARSGQLQDELLAGGYPPDTPCVIAFQVTWPDELIIYCRLAELAAAIKEHKLWKHTLVLVGPGLAAGGSRSHLYHPGHFHGFRKADPQARKQLRAADQAAADQPAPDRATAADSP